MRTIITFADGNKPNLELNNVSNIGVNDVGMIVLSDSKKQPLGIFPIHAIAGVYHPDGPDTVVLAGGALIQ